MVRATLTGKPIKRNRRWQNNNTALMFTGNNENLINKLATLVDIIRERTIPIEEKYEKTSRMLKTETRRANKTKISLETQRLLEGRKKLLQIKENSQEKRNKIREISKNINESIRKDGKIKRRQTLEKRINRTGGIKKAIKELKEKSEWILGVKTKNKTNTRKKPEILKVATDFYRELYQSKNPRETTEKLNLMDAEPVPIILKEETIKAITTQKNRHNTWI